MTASSVSFERDRELRIARLRAAARDLVAERRRPSRAKMRALRVAPGGRIEWRSAPAPPPPGPKEAIVHPIAVATCDLDRAIMLGRTPFPMPFHYGHESIAEVVEVGSEVERVKVGERVVVPFQINCGECGACRAGLTGNCLAVPPLSMYGFGVAGGHWGGHVADLFKVPFADAMLVTLPEGIDPAAAVSVSDNVCDGHRHVAPHLPSILERDPGATVLILAAQTPRPPLRRLDAALRRAGRAGPRRRPRRPRRRPSPGPPPRDRARPRGDPALGAARPRPGAAGGRDDAPPRPACAAGSN